MANIFKTIKKILFTIIGIAYFAFALCMTILLLNYNDYGVTQFGKKQMIFIREELAIPDFNKGDLVIVEQVKLENISAGDKIFTYKIGRNKKAEIQYGIVGEVYVDDEAIVFENGDTYSLEFIAGKAIETHPKVGTFLSIIESQWGFLFLVLVPIFLIFIYQVYALIIEIKYGAEKY